MRQGKIERWHRSMKNQVLLENYYLPDFLKARIGEFIAYYNSAILQTEGRIGMNLMS